MKKFLTLVLAIAMAAMAVSAFAVEADLVFGAQETGTGGYTYAIAIQTAICLIGTILFDQFALTTHRFLTIEPGVIQV